MHHLNRRARHFLRDESGLIMTEFLILLPLLLWAFMALFVYWDAFRTINESQKAAYAVADLITRQTAVNRTFLGGMDDVVAYLIDVPVNRVRVRVTSIQWDASANRYRRLFSESPGSKMSALTETQINAANFRARIPTMQDAGTAIVVETFIDYVPPLAVPADKVNAASSGDPYRLLRLGIPESVFGNFIVTAPRDSKICLTENPCSNAL